MGDFSFSEMLVIILVIVVLFGPKKIPEMARELGRGVRKMRGAMEDIKTEILKDADNPVSEIKKEIEEVKKSVKDINPMKDIKKEIIEIQNFNAKIEEKQQQIESHLQDDHEGPVSR